MFIERLKEMSAYCGFLQADEAVAPVLGEVRRSLNQYARQLAGGE